MKKFNYKLTMILVSFFISIILCAFSNLSKYCMFFGFLMMGVTSALAAWYKIGDFNKELEQVDIEMQNATPDEQKVIIKIVRRERRRLIVGFGGLAVFMIIVAFMSLFA